jgi:hypothetical protein
VAGAIAYHLGGWTAVTVLGAALPAMALLAWTTEPGRGARREPPGATASARPR